MYFQFGHQEHVQNAKAVIVIINDDRSTGWGPGKEVLMLHMKCAAVAEMNSEGAERLRMKRALQLFNSHTANCSKFDLPFSFDLIAPNGPTPRGVTILAASGDVRLLWSRVD